MDGVNFSIGERFPLPITAMGDGGILQADVNGIMFILQLSRADVIAIEAFRTGTMELALYEQGDLLFFLYKIDGIFKDGWGVRQSKSMDRNETKSGDAHEICSWRPHGNICGLWVRMQYIATICRK